MKWHRATLDTVAFKATRRPCYFDQLNYTSTPSNETQSERAYNLSSTQNPNFTGAQEEVIESASLQGFSTNTCGKIKRLKLYLICCK